MLRAALVGLTLVSLTACTASGPRTPYGRFMEARANPGKVVATELAFARAAQENGQWTAFAEFAADDAILFSASGFTPAREWLSKQRDPESAVTWTPHEVLSSCDGSLAITRGAFAYPAGQSGTYITVWERQRDGDYKWIADGAYAGQEAPGDASSVKARTASCDSVPPLLPMPATPIRRGGKSVDGTLAWDAFHKPGKGTSFFARILEGGERVVAIDAVQEAGDSAE